MMTSAIRIQRMSSIEAGIGDFVQKCLRAGGGKAARFDGDGAFLYFDQRAKHKRSDQGQDPAHSAKETALRIQTRASAGRR